MQLPEPVVKESLPTELIMDEEKDMKARQKGKSEAQTTMLDWIPLSQSYPAADPLTWILVADAKNVMLAAYFGNWGNQQFYDFQGTAISWHTHWMPLPDPPSNQGEKPDES